MFYILAAKTNTFVACPKAKRITIPGFEAFTFFIHRPYQRDETFDTKRWVVTEASSGFALTFPRPTQREAIESASKRLKDKDTEMMSRELTRVLTQYGASPWRAT